MDSLLLAKAVFSVYTSAKIQSLISMTELIGCYICNGYLLFYISI